MTLDQRHGHRPREICIVMLSAIGDAVHVLPVANALRRAWPTSRITWVIQPVPYQLVKNHPAIDDFVVFERRRGLAGLRSFLKYRREIRDRRFDLVIGLQVYFKAGVLTALTPSTVKLGFDRARARDGQWLFTNARIPHRAPQHVQDQYLEFLEHLGIDSDPIEWRLGFSEDERAAQSAYFQDLPSRACAVVVGTSKAEKNWSIEGYAQVIEALARDHGLTPILIGGPSSTERAIAARVAEAASVPVRNELGDDLRRLTWLIDGSALVISPDTGPLHIARALGVPVVGLYGYTNPKRSGPYRKYVDLVVDGYARYPGEEYSAGPGYRDGMKRIEVGHVLEKVTLAMERYVGP